MLGFVFESWVINGTWEHAYAPGSWNGIWYELRSFWLKEGWNAMLQCNHNAFRRLIWSWYSGKKKRGRENSLDRVSKLSASVSEVGVSQGFQVLDCNLKHRQLDPKTMRNITVIESILSEWKKMNKLGEKNKQRLWMSQKDPGKPSNGKEERSWRNGGFLASICCFPILPCNSPLDQGDHKIAKFNEFPRSFLFSFLSIDFNVRLNFKVTQNIHWARDKVYSLE